MAASPPSSNIVADRYLVSPTALAGNPSGPIDALDTHSGRASQVRLVFLTSAWDDDALAAAVARWRGIACGEVCGVLDFGRHRGHWYLALPPSLGVPVVRWRAMRHPGPADAARLVLGFGRLVERVAAAGFEPELAGVDDFAVGPGPTPFLERPLLPLPGADPEAPTGGGQRMLSRLLDALMARRDIPDGLLAWAERAATAGFGSLGECLDDLERAGTEAAEASGAEPPGLSGIFADDELDAMERAASRDPGRRRRIASRVAVAVAAGFVGLGLVVPGPHSDEGAHRSAPTTVPVTALTPASDPAPHPAHRASAKPRKHRRTAAHPRRRHRSRTRVVADGSAVDDPARVERPGRTGSVDRRDDRAAGARRDDAARSLSRAAATIAGMRPPTDDELRLYETARAAARQAYAPYSEFPVGAALLPAGGGEPILGVNVENASYGLTSCAERNAVFAAVGAGLRDFSAIAVHAEAGSAPPCGACRQVLAEFSPSMTVVYRSGGEVVATTAAELLPDRFEP